MVFVGCRFYLSVRSNLWHLSSNIQLCQNRIQNHFELEKVDRSGIVARAKGCFTVKANFKAG
jgi:hypothetical protein